MERSLRTHTSAAPLKLKVCDEFRGGVCNSPHSHECGSVEAIYGGEVLSESGGSLRTHTSAAPLKRRSGTSLRIFVDGSPHSHECGSVEATPIGLVRVFHAVLSALTRVRLR